jgi:hypothetical protein
MIPVLSYLVAGLVTAGSLGHNARSTTETRIGETAYECPATYKLATRKSGEVICLRFRKDLPR